MKIKSLKVAIIGAGRWGINHVKTANSLVESKNIFVCDGNIIIKEKIKTISEDINFTTNFDEILQNSEINTVIVASPAETHFSISKELLKQKKHVLVEKPITLHLNEAIELNDLAVENNVKLMVGHVLLYHPAILYIKEAILSGKLGKLQYIYSNRLNLGAIRSEENILWSFAPHDISIIQFLVEKDPISVVAHGDIFLQSNIEDTTITYLKYPDNVSAHIFVSWLHPFKEQRLVVIGEKGMFVFDDTIKTEKLKFYNKGFLITENGIEKFDQDYEAIELQNVMPLAEEQIHFYNSILNDQKPRTNGEHAISVQKILEAATKSLKQI
ncbi:MAG TPA: Gfo/Idh/MocA family oxidoreductase [Melioribacteraceae bacterium]|nr:Gfo/Idh/MocA family oxidoreductase [Melioribacteraceae bacterium]